MTNDLDIYERVEKIEDWINDIKLGWIDVQKYRKKVSHTRGGIPCKSAKVCMVKNNDKKI